MLYLVLSISVLLGGVLLWYFGRRGKRLDDHPTCRKCRYDLVGLPIGAIRCSECGANVTTKCAIRLGNRRQHPSMAWTGLLLALLALPAIGIAGQNWWQNFDKWPWMPFYVLEREYKTRVPQAMFELQSRLAHGKVSHAQATQLVRDMIAWQDDPSVTLWGFPFDLVRTARSDLLRAGVDPALIAAYDDHPFRINAKCHAQAVRGAFFPFRLTLDIRPTLDFFPETHEVTHLRARVRLGDNVIELQSLDELRLSESAYDRHSLVMGTDSPEFWRHEHNGRIEGALTVEMDVETGQRSPTHVIRSIPFSTIVLAPGSPIITFVDNPMLNSQMVAAFRADKVEMNAEGRLLLWHILLGFSFHIGALPENVALDVHFEQAGRRWKQGVLIRAAGADPLDIYLAPRLAREQPPDSPPRYFIGLPWRRGLSTAQYYPTDLRADLSLELVLTSNPDLATTHTGFDRVWQGEIRIPVPITTSKWGGDHR